MAKLRLPLSCLLTLAALSLSAFLPCSNAHAQAGRGLSPKAAKLEGLPYQQARKIILDYGWRPHPSSSCGMQVGKSTCTHFPEIGSCSGVDPGYCGMAFALKDRCLYVVTRGGPPDGDAEGDTHVDHITFRSGPCVND